MVRCRDIDHDGRLQRARQVLSPNHDERPPGMKVEVLIIHCISLPAGQFGTADVEALFTNRLDTAARPAYAELAGLRVSAHLFIRRDGGIVQFVPFGRRAWHAGVSLCEGRDRVNDFSIGIELEGTEHEPFEETQYRVLVDVTRALIQVYPDITDRRLYGHADIAPGRKTDPGPYFDWGRYRAAVLPFVGPREDLR
ncbi:MAG: 1,6-anhydro-N-acetylmuramyl-L-alanine amidase AmpD [Acidiferrobacter sp.]